MITELTEADREAWCSWYRLAYAHGKTGFPDHPLSPLQPNGMTMNTACTNGGTDKFMCQAIIPGIPEEYCRGNLALSTCEAPLSELSDCILTVIDSCWPAPHGCARFMDRPNCHGTMAIDSLIGSDAGGGNCNVKVQ